MRAHGSEAHDDSPAAGRFSLLRARCRHGVQRWLLGSSLGRKQLRLQYERWRAVHGALAAAVLFVGIVHGFQVGHHLDVPWKKTVWVLLLGCALLLLVHSRGVRPWLMRSRPYVVTNVHQELPDVCSLTFAPAGHDGMRFRAGRYAWITLGDTPFQLQQHPFSFSSGEHEDGIRFTAKAVGDFTATWKDIPVGSRAYLEGPYGAFVLDAESEGAVLIAGGIGITPIMSILRTLSYSADRRPFTLFYATSHLERAVFATELTELSDLLDLDVHHVLEVPPDGWDGPSGYLSRDLLDRYLPQDRLVLEYFICGPAPMMDTCETALRELGVSWRQIYTERFQVI
jgi:predicted ferric reductase